MKYIHVYMLNSNHKIPKFLDTRKNCCSLPKIQAKWSFCGILSKDANGIGNSEDPDQTAPGDLIWVCTVCPHLSV